MRQIVHRTSTRWIKALSLGGAGLLAAYSLSGCSAITGKSDTPGDPATGNQMLAQMAQVDDSTVHGLSEVTYRDDARHVTAQVPQIKGARNLSQALEVVREHDLRVAHWASASSVDLHAKMIASSPEVLGVAVDSTSAEAGKTVNRLTTIWYDAAAKQSYASPILIDESKWPNFRDAVTKAAQDQGLDTGAVTRALDSDPAPQGHGPGMSFTRAGDLVVAFESGAVGADPVEVRVPKDQVSGDLSKLGNLAEQAATKPTAYTAEDATPPANSATPNNSSTPSTPAAVGNSATPGHSSPKGTTGKSATGKASPSPSATPSPTPSATPDAGSRPSTAIGPDCRKLKCVALTYDDGPAPGTPKVLQAFDAAHGATTFFEMGNSIKGHEDLTRQVASSGYEIGNHTVTHPDLARTSGSKLESEIHGNSDTLHNILGRPPLLFRPPYGSHNAASDKIITDNGMAIIQWSVDTNDWKTRNTAMTEKTAITDGAKFTAPIVLMHDIHDSSVAAAPTIVKSLQDQGATLVTISELTLNSGGVYPGHGYCRGTQVNQEGFACAG